MEININFKLFEVIEIDPKDKVNVCSQCYFNEKGRGCPEMYGGMDLCRSLTSNGNRVIFVKMPTFEEDIATLVQSFHCAGTHANTIKQFLSEERVQALLAIATRHEVI